MPIVKLPIINPVRIFQSGHNLYRPFRESIPDFETQLDYCQIFQKGDVIRFQVVCSTSVTVAAYLVDANDASVGAFTAEATVVIDGSNYYTRSLDTTSIAEGYYQIKMTVNSYTFYSEPIHLLTTHLNSILLEFTHDENNFSAMFVDGSNPTTKFYFRVIGGCQSDGVTPVSKDVAFIDQKYNVELLDSIPYLTYKLIIGDTNGVPNWVADKINRIFACRTVKINDKYFAKTDGAKLERQSISDKHPMAVWTLDIIPEENDYSDAFSFDTGDFNDDFNQDYLNV